jgi:hypothetical protein
MRLPALEAYADRIGAEQINFRKYMVKEYNHDRNYYTEKAIIRIGIDGSVTVTDPSLEPTEDEATAIRTAVLTANWPRAVLATSANARELEQRRGMTQVAAFWNLARDGIVMLQERREGDGRKKYVSWTLFSDGEWRAMEPDGSLPFWKPEVTRPRIMIHEGAKAAMAADRVGDRHPWRDELAQYAHWGMIGGALAPHRTDYSELRRARPTEVVYVCDNDWEGQAALQIVSKAYGGALKGVRFDGRWPLAWDMADDMPENLFVRNRWIGPRLRDLMVPATHATETLLNGRRTYHVIRRAFKEEWLHCVRPEVFVHRDWPDRMLSDREFNNTVRPFSDVEDTARLMRVDGASKTAVIKYDPSKKPGIYGSGDSGRFINTHVPSSVKAEAGDPGPFLEFVANLIPVESDRTEILRWIATLIAKPEIKMNYGVLLISETQGVGKGTLGERILCPLVGRNNASFPSESDIVDSNFNYWQAHKRLAVVHEIYAGHSSKAYNKLKSVLTDKECSVRKKYLADYDIDNWLHVFACSNSMRAIQLSGDDRRWFVPKVTDEKKTPEYWNELNRWLTDGGGLEAIKHWAETWLKTNDAVDRSSSAPWSTQKKEVIEEGYSPGQSLVSGLLDKIADNMQDQDWIARNTRPQTATNGEWKSPGVAIYDVKFVKLIRAIIYDGRQNDRLEKPLTIRKVAKAKGWFVHPDQVAVDATWRHGRVLCSSKSMTEIPIKELLKTTRVLDVEALAKEWMEF